MSLLKRIFGGKKLPPVNYGDLGTDVHSHFIPGIDDGAKTLEDSINLIRGMAEFGYKKVITTPHVMSDFYRNTPEIILSGLEDVRKAVKEAGIDIEVEAAAEYNVDSDLEEKIYANDILSFGDNYVLFELPFSGEPSNLNNCIFAFQTAGYKPILAHVERYNFWHGNWEKIESMLDRGVRLQLNINSLSGYYGPGVKRMGEELVEKGVITLLGSDCHHVGHQNLMRQTATKKHLHKLMEQDNLLNREL